MDLVLTRPALAEINSFISKVDAYPVSVDELVDLARKFKAPRPVVEFYRSFGRYQLFHGQDELRNRSEQVDMLRQEERDMPHDSLSVPEED